MSRSSRRTGFAVASLLLLTAVVAIYAAAIMSVRAMDRAPQPEEIAAFAVLGFAFGVTCGFFLGIFHGSQKRDIAFGIVEGAVFGPPTFALLAIPESLPVVLVGGVVLVGFALIIRRFTPKHDNHGEAD